MLIVKKKTEFSQSNNDTEPLIIKKVVNVDNSIASAKPVDTIKYRISTILHTDREFETNYKSKLYSKTELEQFAQDLNLEVMEIYTEDNKPFIIDDIRIVRLCNISKFLFDNKKAKKEQLIESKKQSAKDNGSIVQVSSLNIGEQDLNRLVERFIELLSENQAVTLKLQSGKQSKFNSFNQEKETYILDKFINRIQEFSEQTKRKYTPFTPTPSINNDKRNIGFKTKLK